MTSAAVVFDRQYSLAARGASFRTVNGIGLYALPCIDALGMVDHGFTARTGGVSEGCFSSLNLSFTRPEERANVSENYRRLSLAAGFPFESMVLDHYEHGTTVRRVDRQDCGCGYLREALPFCDGVVTNDPAVTLITGHADCMALYVVDPVTRCIGLAHAGWRGALGRMGKCLVEALCREYGAVPADLVAGVGPSICPDCFEVGEDVARLFLDAFPDTSIYQAGKPGKAYIDLWKVMFRQFCEAGVLPQHIAISGVCTMEDGRLFSYRREGKTGGMAAYLRLK